MKHVAFHALALLVTIAATGCEGFISTSVGSSSDKARPTPELAKENDAGDPSSPSPTPSSSPHASAKLTDPACVDPDLAKLASDQTLMLCNGTLAHGTMTVATACSATGEIGCITTATFIASSPAPAPEAPDPWNVRAGVTVNGVVGKLKTNCRNTVNTTVYDDTSVAGHAGADVWDTLNDRDGIPAQNPWGSTNFVCGSEVWEASGADAGTTPGYCNDDADECVYVDHLSGLTWTEVNPYNAAWNPAGVAAGDWPCGGASCTQTNGVVTSGGGSGTYANGGLRWWDAIYACDKLDFAGHADWRLPTHKEWMQAQINGIMALQGPNFNAGFLGYNWTATTSPNAPNGAIAVRIWSTDSIEEKTKTTSFSYTCVR